MDARTRAERIEQYEAGPGRLRDALGRVPPEALAWRPGPGRWSAHEVVVHCADSEANAAARLRYLVAEAEPRIVGYDQDAWARTFDYASQDLEDALAVVTLARRTTARILRRLKDEDWARRGTHTEHGAYGVEDWMRIYADHLEAHARQIERNVEAWRAAKEGR